MDLHLSLNGWTVRRFPWRPRFPRLFWGGGCGAGEKVGRGVLRTASFVPPRPERAPGDTASPLEASSGKTLGRIKI